jgi:hypothetical protein
MLCLAPAANYLLEGKDLACLVHYCLYRAYNCAWYIDFCQMHAEINQG